MADVLKDAWDSLYSGRSRSWRGSSDVSWMHIPPGSSVLDAGCGNGKTSISLVEAGHHVTGIDFSELAVQYCKEALEDRANFLVADVRSLPFPDGSFEAVAAVHILEHVPSEDIGRACSELLRVLVPGGRIYIRTFALGDFRSRGRKEDVRNGILYRYFTRADIISMFSSADIISIREEEEATRFRKMRRRLYCVIGRSA